MASVSHDPARRKTPWVVRWRDPAGRQKKKGFARKVDADRYRAQIEHSLNTGAYNDPMAGRVTFREYAERWRAAQPHRPNTRMRVQSQLHRHVYPAIGDRPMVSITRSDLQALVASLPLSASSIRTVFATVKAVFADAYRDRLIPYNPAGQRNIRMPELPIERITPLAPHQVDALAGAVPARYRDLVAVAAMTGLRQGEIFGLEVDALDLDGAVMHIRQQVQPAPGGGVVICPPKNRHSYRSIPLADAAVRRLRRHLEAYPPVEVEVEDTTGRRPVRRTARFVFTDEAGKPLERGSFNERVWRPAREVAGVPDEGMHALRHFYASLLIRAGLSPKLVADRLGHSDPAMTLRVYAHLWPDDEDRSRQAIEAVAASSPVFGQA